MSIKTDEKLWVDVDVAKQAKKFSMVVSKDGYGNTTGVSVRNYGVAEEVVQTWMDWAWGDAEQVREEAWMML